jgi:flagellar protein FliO/FliZ
MNGSFQQSAAQTGRRLVWSLFSGLPFFVPPAMAAEETAPATSVTTPVVDLAQTATLAFTLIKVFGALLLTVGIMLLLVLWLKKLGLHRAGLRQGALINIIDTKMIAPKKYVAVVQIAEEMLAIGITEQQITMLTRLDSSVASLVKSPQEEQQHPSSFAALLGKTLKRGGQ